MTPTRNNRGVSHENGAIESPHGHLESQLEDALLLRGVRDFETMPAWRGFVDEIVGRGNARNAKRVDLERPALKRCRPAGRPITRRSMSRHVFQRLHLAQGVLFGALRLIGQRLRVHLHDNRLECFLGSTRS